MCAKPLEGRLIQVNPLLHCGEYHVQQRLGEQE